MKRKPEIIRTPGSPSGISPWGYLATVMTLPEGMNITLAYLDRFITPECGNRLAVLFRGELIGQ